MDFNQKIEEVERNFEMIASSKPEALSARNFQMGMYFLLHDCKGFKQVGDTAKINQYYSDIYEDIFFGGKPKGFNKTVPLEDLEDYSKRLKIKPENYSRVASYKRGYDRVNVYSHHDSLDGFLQNRLKSSNLSVSTTIASKNNLLSTKCARILMKNPGELIMEGDNMIEEAFRKDLIISYRTSHDKEIILFSPFQIVDMTRRNINSLSGPRPLSTSA
ncbi:MAG: hypothetical protein V1818_00665 [Candidatus Aenigmatarchaeota archaeon]